MTKTSDMMYVGMMGGEDDRSDAIISWSDNVEDQPNFGPDRLRFIFTNEPPATPIMTAQELHGLELARIIPDPNGNEGYFGIGDWNTAGVEPDERLDVLDRTVRIRQLVPDYFNDTLDRYVVTDSTGRLHWRPFPAGSTTDCTWEENVTNNLMTTAWRATGTNNSCPEQDWKVGIGVAAPTYKLDVRHNEAACATCPMNGALNLDLKTDNAGSASAAFIRVGPASGQSTTDLSGINL